MSAQQAYIEGFVKRAVEHGFSQNEAMYILKQANTVNYPPSTDVYNFKPKSLMEGLRGGAYRGIESAQKPWWVNPTYLGSKAHNEYVGKTIAPLMRKTQPAVRDMFGETNDASMSLAGTPLNLPSQITQGGASTVSPQGVPSPTSLTSEPQDSLLDRSRALARSRNAPLNAPVVK